MCWNKCKSIYSLVKTTQLIFWIWAIKSSLDIHFLQCYGHLLYFRMRKCALTVQASAVDLSVFFVLFCFLFALLSSMCKSLTVEFTCTKWHSRFVDAIMQSRVYALDLLKGKELQESPISQQLVSIYCRTETWPALSPFMTPFLTFCDCY